MLLDYAPSCREVRMIFLSFIALISTASTVVISVIPPCEAFVSQIVRLGMSAMTSDTASNGISARPSPRQQHSTGHYDDTLGLLKKSPGFTGVSKYTSPANCAALPAECFTCTVHANCRFCLMKYSDTAQFIVNNESAELPRLRGACIDLHTTTWRDPVLLTPNPPVYAYCGLFLPDYLNGITCRDADAGSHYAAYRETLEAIQPRFQFIQSSDDQELTLERVLERTDDPAPQHTPTDVLFICIGLPLTLCLTCGCCMLVIWRCCGSGFRLCCCGCCETRQTVSKRGTSSHHHLHEHGRIVAHEQLLSSSRSMDVSYIPTFMRPNIAREMMQDAFRSSWKDTKVNGNPAVHCTPFQSTASTVCTISENSPTRHVAGDTSPVIPACSYHPTSFHS